MSITFNNEDEVYDLYKKTDKEIIIFENKVYEVGSFIVEHPGGPEKIQEYLGKNIDAPFEKEGHSKYARKLIMKLPCIG